MHTNKRLLCFCLIYLSVHTLRGRARYLSPFYLAFLCPVLASTTLFLSTCPFSRRSILSPSFSLLARSSEENKKKATDHCRSSIALTLFTNHLPSFRPSILQFALPFSSFFFAACPLLRVVGLLSFLFFCFVVDNDVEKLTLEFLVSFRSDKYILF